jgi:hypothetical protein
MAKKALAVLPVVFLSFAAPLHAASLEVSARAAYGAAGDKSPTVFEPSVPVTGTVPDEVYAGKATPYGGGAILSGALGIRLAKYVSFGVEGGIRNSSADAVAGTNDLKRSAWFVGPYVRGYIPLVPFLDPWVGIGAQYMRDEQKYQAPVATNLGPRNADWTLEHHGVAIPLSIGVDYTFLGMLAVGPSFSYAFVVPAGGCAKVNLGGLASNSYCADEDESKRITATKSYGVWSLGLNVRFTFPPP